MFFSRNGKRLLIPGRLNTDDLKSTARLIELGQPMSPDNRGNVSYRAAAALSDDGEFVAIGDDIGAVRVWRAGDPSKPILPELRGHEGPVYAVMFSHDAKFIATAGQDQTARLWRSDQPMAIASDKRSLEKWRTRPDELVRLARRTAGRNLSSKEWSAFFPDEEYRPTFPDLPVHRTGKQP